MADGVVRPNGIDGRCKTMKEIWLTRMMYSVGRKDAPSYLETWWWSSDVRKAEDENRYRFWEVEADQGHG